MDTPEAAKRASASLSVQLDSPFVTYVNSLSPIKPSNAGTAAHVELTVPSPQPVFTSPHINLPRKVNILRRSQRSSVSGSEYFTPGNRDDTTPYIEDAEISRQSVSLPMLQLIPCTQEGNNDDSSQDDTSGSHLSCVDGFLADPVGDSSSPSSSPGLGLQQAPKLPRSTQGDDCGTTDKVNKSDKENYGEAQCCTPSAFVRRSMVDPEGSTSTLLPDKHESKPTELTHDLQSESGMLKDDTLNLNITEYKKETDSVVFLNLNSSFQAEDDQNGQGPSSPLNLVDIEGSLEVLDNPMRISEQLELVCNSVNDGTDTDLSSVQPSGTQNERLYTDQIAFERRSVMSKDSDIVVHGKASSASSFCCHRLEDVKLHFFQNGNPQESNFTPQLETMQKIKEAENTLEDAGVKASESSDDQLPHEQEEGTQQVRGMRKRLQFEAVETHILSSGRDENSSNFTIVSDAQPPGIPLNLDNINFRCAESIATANNKQTIRIVNHPGNALCRLSQCSYVTPEAHAGEVDRTVPRNESSFASVPRSSGIGLHLNSVGSVVPTNFNSNMQLPGKKSLCGNKVSLDPQYRSTSTSLKVCHSVASTASSENPMLCAATEDNEKNLQENQPMKELNSSTKFKSLLDVKPMSSFRHANLTNCYISTCNTKKPSENSSMSEESTQTSPRKKRKKSSDIDGSKSCNCKRSKCLKLYCDCFAAGAYCTEDCSCQECFNRPEHQDVVLGTRQQIESRNPLAFVPKVVIRVNESQKDIGNSKPITPTAARHKRGCNCKKSLCLKKYCECYQAGVGCSFGCRCEGCQNSFGRKEEFSDITELEPKSLQKEEYKKSMDEESKEPSCGRKLKGIGARIETISAKLHHSRLSPLTPALQGSSENDALQTQFPSSYYPSPESGASVLPSFMESPSSLGIPVSSSASTEARAVVPYDHKPYYHSAAKVDSFSPGWDGFPDICNLSPLPNPSPVASNTPASSQTRQHKVLQTKLFQGSGQLSSGTLRWRSSPITPLPHFCGDKFAFEADSGCGQHNIIEDDTPDVLKETQPPIKETKATSPNQKRVSPPHKLSNKACSSISPSMKNGRKFILKSVPSFPPLTPYSNSTRQQDR